MKCTTRLRSVRQNEETEEHRKRRRGHHEEVDRGQIPNVVVEERAPSLGGGSPPPASTATGCAGTPRSQAEEFAVDAGGAPQGVGHRHRPDQRAQFVVDARAGHEASRPAIPVPLESLPEPADDRFGLNQDQRVLPPIPRSHEPHPEEAIGQSKRGPPYLAQDSDLLAKRELLQRQVAPIPEGGAQGLSWDSRMPNMAMAVSSDPHARSTSRSRSRFGKRQDK